jgi:hypothetical protein
VLIDLRRYYPQTVFPRLREAVAELARSGRLRWCDQVVDECKDDELKEFIATYPECRARIEDFEPQLAGLMRLHQEGAIKAVKPSVTRSEADPFVIALGLALAGRPADQIHVALDTGQEGVVVSAEGRKLGAVQSGQIHMIPDICDRLNLPHRSFLEFLTEIGYSG